MIKYAVILSRTPEPHFTTDKNRRNFSVSVAGPVEVSMVGLYRDKGRAIAKGEALQEKFEESDEIVTVVVSEVEMDED